MDLRSYDGPSYTTILVVRDPIFKVLPLFLSVHQRTHATNHLSHVGLFCTTVLVVRDPVPKGPSLFFYVSLKEQLRRTVIPTTVRPAQPFWLSETLFLRFSHFFLSVLQWTHATDRHTYDGLSCTTVLVVKDPFRKGVSQFFKCP